MSGIIPKPANGGVAASGTVGAREPTIPPVGQAALFLPKNCRVNITAEMWNNLESMILCVFDRAGTAYNSADPCGFAEAIADLVVTTVNAPVVTGACGTIAPVGPAINDLWLDTTYRVVKKWNGSAWVTQVIQPPFFLCGDCVVPALYVNCGSSMSPIFGGHESTVRVTCATSAPAGPSFRDYWYNEFSGLLFQWDGVAWVAVPPSNGPEQLICGSCSAPRVYVNCGTSYSQITKQTGAMQVVNNGPPGSFPANTWGTIPLIGLYNSIVGASVAANLITLPVGEYTITGSQHTGLDFNAWSAVRVVNNSTNLNIVVGASVHNNQGGDFSMTSSPIYGAFIAPIGITIRIENINTGTLSDNYNSGVNPAGSYLITKIG